jgi:hypothetical protein
MMFYSSKYPLVARFAVIFVLMIVAAPFLTSLLDLDGCCDESGCCDDYLSCHCACHMIAASISTDIQSPYLGASGFIGALATNTSAEGHPQDTERPPRLFA